MNLWRICKRRYSSTAFSGIGAERIGGRWNTAGHRMVYCSENLSLASLELFVHLNPSLCPNDLVVIKATLPDSVSCSSLEERELPKNWREYPAPEELQILGDQWLFKKLTLVLSVPSAVIPQEKNLLLNPIHADFRLLKITKPIAFQFDPRLFV